MTVPNSILRITRILGNTFCFLGKCMGILFVMPYFLPLKHHTIWAGNYFSPDPQQQIHSGSLLAVYERLPAQAAKEQLLMVHGFSGSQFSFRKNIQCMLDSGYRVKLLDLPGFGHAAKGPGFDYADTTRNKTIVQELSALTILGSDGKTTSMNSPDGKWILIGHSMGAAVVLEVASLVPKKIKAIVLIDGFALPASSKENVKRTSFYFPPLGRWADVIGSNYIFNEKTFKGLLRSAYASEPVEEDVYGYLNPFRESANSASAVFRMAAGQGNAKVDKEKIKNIPLLMLWGEKDTWIPLPSSSAFLKEFPQTRFVKIKEAGHCPMETHAQAVNKEILNFIQSLSAVKSH